MPGKGNINDTITYYMRKILFIGYGLIGLLVFLYSYTQVDLGLTLTQLSLWQTIQKSFQHIGYFQRPFSTALYGFLLVGLFILYGLVLRSIHQKQLSIRSLWVLIILTFVLLVFSYPAFSYDFFNYMFTAKTVLLYHKNPYEIIPLQFTGYESWLSFLHWTHLPSAYAPAWIALTLIPYFFGFGYFLLILWNFKLTIGFFYLLSVWAIGKLLEKENKTVQMMGIALFALNPLILIESLVSGHNDIVMMGIAALALVFLSRKNYIYSFFFLSLSIALKEITIVLLPLYISWKHRFFPFVLMSVGLVLFLLVFKREMLPWYGIWVLPFAALIPNISFYMPLVYGFSLGLLLSYMPFLYYGHWNDPVPFIKLWLTVLPMITGSMVMMGKWMIVVRKGK